MNSGSSVGINGSIAIGDKLVVIAAVQNAASLAISSILFRDSGNATIGTLSSGGAQHNSNKGSIEVWYWDVTSNIADISTYNVQGNWSGAASNNAHILLLHKITGSPASGAPPQTNSNGTSSGATAWNGGAVTPTNTGVIAFACGLNNSTTSQTPTASGFTILDNFTSTGAPPAGRNIENIYSLPGSTSPITTAGTWISNSTGWDAIAWTWNPTSAIVATPQPGFRFSF